MSEDAELKQMALQLNEAIEKGMDDETPHLSIDPKTTKPAVVGDPNAIPEKKGTYKLTFAYPPDQVSAEDKAHMKKHEKTGYYLAEVKYENVRIKPLHRARIATIATQVLADARVIDLQGYTSEQNTEILGEAFLNHTEDIVAIMKMVLDLNENQVGYLMPTEPTSFFVQLFQNEPNLIKESANFLS